MEAHDELAGLLSRYETWSFIVLKTICDADAVLEHMQVANMHIYDPKQTAPLNCRGRHWRTVQGQMEWLMASCFLGEGRCDAMVCYFFDGSSVGYVTFLAWQSMCRAGVDTRQHNMAHVEAQLCIISRSTLKLFTASNQEIMQIWNIIVRELAVWKLTWPHGWAIMYHLP